jgi:hypothetical protein
MSFSWFNPAWSLLRKKLSGHKSVSFSSLSSGDVFFYKNERCIKVGDDHYRDSNGDVRLIPSLETTIVV